MNGSDCNGDITSDVTRYILLDLHQSSKDSLTVRDLNVSFHLEALAVPLSNIISPTLRLSAVSFLSFLFLPFPPPQRCGPAALHHCPEHHIFANGSLIRREEPGFPHEAYITTSAGLRYERKVAWPQLLPFFLVLPMVNAFSGPCFPFFSYTHMSPAFLPGGAQQGPSPAAATHAWL